MTRYIPTFALALFVLVACATADPLQLACSSLASANNIATPLIDADKFDLDQILIIERANDIAKPICASEERPSNVSVAITLVTTAVGDIEKLIEGF